MGWNLTPGNKGRFAQTPGAGPLVNQGNNAFATGQGLTGEGLAGLRDQAGTYQDMINKGGLPDDIRQQFNIARGGLQDNATRMQRAFLANMAQKYATSGGTLNPAASTEFALENQKQSDEGLFNATNNLNMGEAQTALTNTNSLYDRIDNIRNTILGAGQGEEQRGQAAQIASMNAKLEHRKAMAGFFKFW